MVRQIIENLVESDEWVIYNYENQRVEKFSSLLNIKVLQMMEQ